MNRFASKEEEKLYYEHEASEEEFLNWYQKQERPEYDKPSLTVDIVLMCYNKEEDQLKVLLIQRKGHPYRNSWALPGGWCDVNVSVMENTIKEVKEEAGLDVVVKNVIAIQDRKNIINQFMRIRHVKYLCFVK